MPDNIKKKKKKTWQNKEIRILRQANHHLHKEQKGKC